MRVKRRTPEKTFLNKELAGVPGSTGHPGRVRYRCSASILGFSYTSSSPG
jgi:hypothetical protein